MPSHPVVQYPHQQAMQSFARMPSYANHMQQPVFHRQPLRKRYTGGAGPFPCPKCGRYFRRRADMQRHQRKRNPCAPNDSKVFQWRSVSPCTARVLTSKAERTCTESCATAAAARTAECSSLSQFWATTIWRPPGSTKIESGYRFQAAV